MTSPSRSLPELEVQLISRKSARRQAALQALRGDSFRPRWAWGLGLAAIWALVPMGSSRYGEGFATFLGLTKNGLSWTCILLAAVVLLALQVFVLDKKVKALTHLILDEPAVSPNNAMQSNARDSG